MSCQFKLFASIIDVDKLKTLLFTSDFITSAIDGEDSWNWSDVEPVPDNWLDECCVSLSPSSELLVFARERNLIILNGKWDSEDTSEGSIKYHISWSGDITQEYAERITCVLCLPLAGQGKLTTHGGADWTPVAVGFSSGAIRFYTENGSLLLSEVLHEEPIRSLKCHTLQPQISTSMTSQVDELYVVHTSVVCCIQGFALCNTLKASRSQLARVEAKCTGKLEFEPLVLSKWGLPEQEDIVDVAILGSSASSMFNHLTTASLRGGYLATYRSGPPQVTSVLGTGSSPFLAWHGLVEGTSGPVLTDVAKAVASKLKSAIGSAVPGWLGVNKKAIVEKVKEKVSLEPAEAMACRFGLCDFVRKGQRIYLSPQKNLSACCDSLGRVTLVDNISGIALRMWKGYRDAECAFISVFDDRGPGKSRQALYLAIYAPKKAVIEIWALQQGPKVITFTTSKNGRLMYIRHGLMGANSVFHKHISSSQHPCIYITATGELKQVCIPFHPILSSKSDAGSREVYLFKQLSRLLRTSYENSLSEIPLLCKEMNSYDFKLQVLLLAASVKHITPLLMMSIIEQFQSSSSVPENEEPENETIIAYRTVSERFKNLTYFFMRAVECLDSPPEYSTVVPSSPAEDEEVLSKVLKVSLEEVERLLTLISFSSTSSKVSFSTNEGRFMIYLSSFENIKSSAKHLSFSSNISTDNLAIIGEALCQCVLYGGCSLEDWRDLALASAIAPKSLFLCSIAYWLKKPLGNNVRSEMSLYVQLLFLITSLGCMKESLSWWDDVRLLITDSEKSLNALTSTIISRAVYIRTEKQIMDERLLDEGDDGWEAISRETCLWTQLIMQVEAVAELQSAVSCRRKAKGDEQAVFPSLDFVTHEISLSNLLLKGPGLVAESIAKWVGSWGLEPEWLLNLETQEEELKTEDGSKSVHVDSSAEAFPSTPKEDVLFPRLERIRKYFPYSVTPLHILANVCWEYVSVWAKHPQDTKLLSAGLQYLNSIPHQPLKLGLCTVIWSVHLKTYFESIVKLLQKIGKLPKDRLCKEHVNIPASAVKDCLQSLVEFYGILLESASTTELSVGVEESEQLCKREAIWTSDCHPSLIDIALAQGEPNFDILKIRSLCAQALLFLAALPIRFYRPVTTLFHPTEESTLWLDIGITKAIPAALPDVKIDKGRLIFLLKVVNYATEAMCSQEMTIDEATHWIGKCYSLAESWNVEMETIRIQQVVNLYKNNGDQFAAELVRSVNSTIQLGSELLVIVGQRMKKIILCSGNLRGMAHLSPTLTNWIQEQEESKELSNVKDVLQLCTLVVNMLPESSADHKFATLLLEGIQPLAA